MKLRVITFNIRFDNPKDGQNAWDFRKDHVKQVIEEYQPLLLGTQEGRRPQLKELEDLIHLKLCESHREWIDKRMYPCIYYNPEKFTPFDSGDIWLSETPYVAGSSSFDSSFPRLCTWIKGEIPETGEKIFYINTHLDHVKKETRFEQIKVLCEEVKKIHLDENLILSGDFNESPEEDVRNQINEKMPELVDPWLELNYKEESSHHKFKGSLPEGKRIDWILSDKKLKINSILIDKSHKDGLYPSDHFPVKAEFEI